MAPHQPHEAQPGRAVLPFSAASALVFSAPRSLKVGAAVSTGGLEGKQAAAQAALAEFYPHQCRGEFGWQARAARTLCAQPRRRAASSFSLREKESTGNKSSR